MRGVEHGLPKLLETLGHAGIKATFFTTGRVAELYPETITKICEAGHELACHGYSHARFDRLDPHQAKTELKLARKILDQFAENIASFRAPNLKLPKAYLPLLEDLGFRIDSSIATYKPPFPTRCSVVGRITRIPATLTSSILRLPLRCTLPVLTRLRAPVLFVHPWEFTNMQKTAVRFDCKFNTGGKALDNLSAIVTHLESKGFQFRLIKDMVSLEKPVTAA